MPYDVLTDNPNAPVYDYDPASEATKNWPMLQGILGIKGDKNDSTSYKVGSKIGNVASILSNLIPLAGAAKAATIAPKAGELSMFAGKMAKGSENVPESSWINRPGLKPMYEIDDSKAALKGVNEGTYTLGQVLDHPELYKAYPDLRNVDVTIKKDKYNGSWQAIQGKDQIIASAPSSAELKSVLLHEANHAIQYREGFAAGGSPERMITGDAAADMTQFYKNKAAVIAQRVQKLSEANSPLTDDYRKMLDTNVNKIKYYDQLSKFPDTPNGQYAAYMATRGEMDSRLVQARQFMSPSKRASTPVAQTEIEMMRTDPPNPSGAPIYHDVRGSAFDNPLYKSTLE